MKKHFYAMISRMKNINRWGLMRNTRNENLSEHSLEVAFISHALAVINNVRLGGSVNPETTAVAAMYHDTTEIITGDMPTPIKYYNCTIKKAYKDIEKVAENRLLDNLPDDFKPTYTKIYNPEADITRLVKAADKISALIKCIEECNMGNREFLVAKDSTLNAIKDLNCPEADIFMEEFLDSFSLSLDELN
jgi:5'-deoxynucleotidase